MITSHKHTSNVGKLREVASKTLKISILGAVIVLLQFTAQAQVFFSGAPGTSAPPTGLGGYTMTPFTPDTTTVNPYGAPIFNTPSVAVPAGGCAGVVGFSTNLDHRRVGTSFPFWSNVYTGDVYMGQTSTIKITLPAGTKAFYFYAADEGYNPASNNYPGITYNVSALGDDGTSSGMVPVLSPQGAKYFGFYATGSTSLMMITVTSSGPRAVIGEFGISCQSAPKLPSDQKAGSLVVFPFYDTRQGSDTRLTLSNVGDKDATVHMFFIDKTCAQSDFFICLTPNASFAELISTFDPENNGHILALAVDRTTGAPIAYNGLIGNEFVNNATYCDTFGAESFWANENTPINETNWTATLKFGSTYDAVPSQLTAEIQSPIDSIGQRIYTVGLVGDVNGGSLTGAGMVGTGYVFDQNEKPYSFSSFLSGTCQASEILDSTRPRVVRTLPKAIPTGMTGTIRMNIGGGVGLLMTPKTNKWKGIRTLHKTGGKSANLIVPVFTPGCNNY
jgi:hypothetical protein